jgi:hypothetical protein
MKKAHALMLIDGSWVEAARLIRQDKGVWLKDVIKSKPETPLETVPFANEVFIPWTSILLLVEKQ